MKRRFAVALVLFASSPAAVLAQEIDVVDGTIATIGSASPVSARTVPLWGSAFTFQGATYPLITVGTDPAAGSATTTIPAVIIPLTLEFADGTVLDASASLPGRSYSALDATVTSPLFQAMAYTTGGVTVGVTQYADAMQRSQFWDRVAPGGTSPDYHVLFGGPTVLPAQRIQVPANLGFTRLSRGSHTRIGFIDVTWFEGRVLQLVGQLHLDPTTLPIFLEHNTFYYFKDPANGTILSFLWVWNDFQAVGRQPVQTFIVSAFTDPGVFRAPMIQDVYILSHELTRWMNDPYGTNVVPPYFAPAWSPFCLTALHVSDPTFGRGFEATLGGITSHLSDTAFLPWFEQVAPSTSVNGYYSFLNTLPDLSPCH